MSGSVTSQDRVRYLCNQDNTRPCSRTPDAQSLRLDYWFCNPVTVLSKDFGRLLHSSQQMGYGSSQHTQLEARSEFAHYASKFDPVLLPWFYILWSECSWALLIVSAILSLGPQKAFLREMRQRAVLVHQVVTGSFFFCLWTFRRVTHHLLIDEALKQLELRYS